MSVLATLMDELIIISSVSYPRGLFDWRHSFLLTAVGNTQGEAVGYVHPHLVVDLGELPILQFLSDGSCARLDFAFAVSGSVVQSDSALHQSLHV